MRARVLAAVTVGVLTVAAVVIGGPSAIAAPASHRAVPELRYPFKGKSCFEGPYHKDHTKPGGACWAGGICMDPASAHFIQGDSSVWCFGQGYYDFKHPKLTHRVLGLQNRNTKEDNYFVVDLVGYVAFDPGNPIPGHAYWPFRDPKLDHAYDGSPVVNIVYVPGGPPVSHSKRIQCVNDLTVVENDPAPFGMCSPEKQFGRDLHDSYMVWSLPGHRIEAVHLTNADQHIKPWCLFADDPGVDDPPWYIRLRHPQGPVHIVGVLQFWYERQIH